MISDDRGQNITPYLSLHLIAFIRYHNRLNVLVYKKKIKKNRSADI